MPAIEFSKDQLLQLIQRDCELYLSFYLGEELTLDVPEMHKELWDEFLVLLDQVNDPNMLTGILRKLLGVPREHAKTTLVKLAVVLFFRYSRLSFCAYISNTFGTALNACKDIRDWLLCSQAEELYGRAPDGIRVEKSSESTGEIILHIIVPHQVRPKCVILKAFGVNTQIRGTNIKNLRPDIMVFDDCESTDTASNPQQQSKLDAWCLGTAMKSMARLGVVIFIGNMISETTLLARLSKEPIWNPTVFGSLIKSADGSLVPLWEGRWTLQALLEDYASYRRLGNGHVWEAEMMNLTNKDIFGEPMVNAIRPPTPDPAEVMAGFICLDPAFGQNAWNDYSSVTVHVRLWGGDIPMIADKWHGRANEEGLMNVLIDMSWKWGLSTWVIESQAAQKLLLTVFRLLLTQRGMSPETFLMIPILAGRESKYSRIAAFRSIVAGGNYGITEDLEDLFIKLSDYVNGLPHDDEEDCASYGNTVWDMFGKVIESQGRQDIAGKIMGNGATGSSTNMLDMGM